MKILIIIPMGINSILLFNRKEQWVLSVYKWYVVMVLLLTSVVLVAVFGNILEVNQTLAIVSWGTPALFSLLDYFFKSISIKLHRRDFYLWLRYSKYIDDTKWDGGVGVKASDRLFSFLLLIAIMVFPFLGLFLV